MIYDKLKNSSIPQHTFLSAKRVKLRYVDYKSCVKDFTKINYCLWTAFDDVFTEIITTLDKLAKYRSF